MLIGCKNLRNHSIVASIPESPVQCPPSDPLFGSDTTSPVCCPIGVLAAQAALAPQVANAKLSVSNDEWEVWQCEQPVSNTHHSKFGTNSVFLRCQQNVLHARSKCANLMPFKCPVNVRGRPHDGSAEFTKVEIQSLYMFLVNGTMPTCKTGNR